MSTRVTYTPCDRLAGMDYVAARYNVLVDGVKVGEATRSRESVETAASARNLRRGPAQYRMTTVWRAEDLQGRSPSRIHYTSRVDAVVNLLEDRGMTHAAARAAAGKRGY